jgi:hypothetical protein
MDANKYKIQTTLYRQLNDAGKVPGDLERTEKECSVIFNENVQRMLMEKNM